MATAGGTTDSNVGATAQIGEPNDNGASRPRSRWYSWTAPVGGRATVQLTPITSGFNGFVAVYNAPDQINTSGSWTNALPIVTATDTLGAGVTATFDAFAGHTYHIAVDRVAKGIFFISSDTGAYSVAVSTSGALGTVYGVLLPANWGRKHIPALKAAA